MGHLLGVPPRDRTINTNKSKPTITSQDQAILDLKVQRDRLTKYQKRLQVVVEREVEVPIHIYYK